jgi:hypothetical protein
MTADVLLYHLAELGVSVSLGASSSELSVDAPRGTLTPELTELLREHKADLIELVYEREEAAAIEEEGRLSDIGRMALKARTPLITVAAGLAHKYLPVAKADARVQSLAKAFGGLEIVGIFESAEEARGVAA